MGSTTGTTTWYAFQDPKSGREYFHEPISGEVSWVLPTSSNNSTRIAGSHAGTGEDAATNARVTKKQRKLIKGWSALGITIASIFVFNTLFLLILVKILYENNTVPSQILDQINWASDGRDKTRINDVVPSDGVEGLVPKEIAIEADSTATAVMLDNDSLAPDAKLINKTLNRKVGKDDVEEEMEKAAGSPEAPSGDSYSYDDAAEVEGVYHPESEAVSQGAKKSDEIINETVENEEQNVHGIEEVENEEENDQKDEAGTGVGEQSDHIIITEDKSNHDVLDESAGSPVNCWIPFPNMFSKNCRDHVWEGLPMALADLENMALI